jgi:hypothetical protein
MALWYASLVAGIETLTYETSDDSLLIFGYWDVLSIPLCWFVFIIAPFGAVGSLIGHTTISVYLGFVVAVLLGAFLLIAACLFGL